VATVRSKCMKSPGDLVPGFSVLLPSRSFHLPSPEFGHAPGGDNHSPCRSGFFPTPGVADDTAT
jgi:hypothetical protein